MSTSHPSEASFRACRCPPNYNFLINSSIVNATHTGHDTFNVTLPSGVRVLATANRPARDLLTLSGCEFAKLWSPCVPDSFAPGSCRGVPNGAMMYSEGGCDLIIPTLFTGACVDSQGRLTLYGRFTGNNCHAKRLPGTLARGWEQSSFFSLNVLLIHFVCVGIIACGCSVAFYVDVSTSPDYEGAFINLSSCSPPIRSPSPLLLARAGGVQLVP